SRASSTYKGMRKPEFQEIGKIKRCLLDDSQSSVPQRFSGGMSLMRAECLAMSSRLYDKWTRLFDGGRFSSERPGRHSVAGRIGRGTKPPPQLGHTLSSLPSTQSAQKVHS